MNAERIAEIEQRIADIRKNPYFGQPWQAGELEADATAALAAAEGGPEQIPPGETFAEFGGAVISAVSSLADDMGESAVPVYFARTPAGNDYAVSAGAVFRRTGNLESPDDPVEFPPGTVFAKSWAAPEFSGEPEVCRIAAESADKHLSVRFREARWVEELVAEKAKAEATPPPPPELFQVAGVVSAEMSLSFLETALDALGRVPRLSPDKRIAAFRRAFTAILDCRDVLGEAEREVHAEICRAEGGAE